MLEIKKLRVERAKSEVLRGISLTVARGEFVAVLGRNGAGKTTLLRSILGYLALADGSVQWDGRELAGEKTHNIIRRGIGFSPEESEVFASLTVEQNLRFPLLNRAARPDDEQLFERVLDVFPTLRRYLPRGGAQLSGGERKMVSIARAMMLDADLLLLDEPFEGLSPLVIPHISSGLAAISKSGKTVLMVESNARHIPDYVARVAILERGEFIFVGALQEARERADLRQYTTGMA